MCQTLGFYLFVEEHGSRPDPYLWFKDGCSAFDVTALSPGGGVESALRGGEPVDNAGCSSSVAKAGASASTAGARDAVPQMGEGGSKAVTSSKARRGGVLAPPAAATLVSARPPPLSALMPSRPCPHRCFPPLHPTDEDVLGPGWASGVWNLGVWCGGTPCSPSPTKEGAPEKQNDQSGTAGVGGDSNGMSTTSALERHQSRLKGLLQRRRGSQGPDAWLLPPPSPAGSNAEGTARAMGKGGALGQGFGGRQVSQLLGGSTPPDTSFSGHRPLALTMGGHGAEGGGEGGGTTFERGSRRSLGGGFGGWDPSFLGGGSSGAGAGLVGLIRSQIQALGRVLSWGDGVPPSGGSGGGDEVVQTAALLSVMVRVVSPLGLIPYGFSLS